MLDGEALKTVIGDSEKETRVASILVLGIGNTLLTDDGLGPFVIGRLKTSQKHQERIDFLDGGTLSFTLLNAIEGREGVIVVDACELHGAPGTIGVFEGADMDLHMRSGSRSVHEVALSDLLDMARMRGILPERRALVGVQPASLDWGLTLTRTVADRVDDVCVHVGALIKAWRT